MLMLFERNVFYDRFQTCGHFNKDEISFLKSQGYKEVWRESTERNKNGIRIDRRVRNDKYRRDC